MFDGEPYCYYCLSFIPPNDWKSVWRQRHFCLRERYFWWPSGYRPLASIDIWTGTPLWVLSIKNIFLSWKLTNLQGRRSIYTRLVRISIYVVDIGYDVARSLQCYRWNAISLFFKVNVFPKHFIINVAFDANKIYLPIT